MKNKALWFALGALAGVYVLPKLGVKLPGM